MTYNINLPDQSDSLCKLIFSIPIYLSNIYPWIMVAFSVDKLLGMRVNSIAIVKKRWFQWSIVAGIVSFNLALYGFIPILIRRGEIFPGYFICGITNTGFEYTLYMIFNLLEASLIPFITMIVTSILTFRMLIKSRKSIERNGKLSRDRKTRDMKYAISSLTLNIIFIICRLPGTVFFILSGFYSYFNVYLYMVSSLMFFINVSSSLFIHLVTNSVFRREFFYFFSFSKRNGETLSNLTSRTNRPIRRNQISVN